MDTGDLNLPAYKYQLEQVNVDLSNVFSWIIVDSVFKVEIALKAKHDDPELLKLKKDLQVRRHEMLFVLFVESMFVFIQEVIEITAELLGCDPSILNSNDGTASGMNAGDTASSSYTSSATASKGQGNSTSTTTSARSAIKWKTGDRCLAPWNEDGK
jgi:hypothetical protein